MQKKYISESRPKSLKVNASWLFFSSLFVTAVSFVITPILIRHIGEDQYGLYVIILSISGLMGFMSFGLGEATFRYVSYYYGRNDMDGINRVIGSTLFFYVIVIAAASLLVLGGSPWFAGKLTGNDNLQAIGPNLLKLTVFIFGLNILSSAIGSISSALQRFDITNKIFVGQSVFLATGIIVIVLKGWGLFELVLLNILNPLLALIIQGIVAKHLVPEIRLLPSPSLAGLKEVFSYGMFSLTTFIFSTMSRELDKLLMATFFTLSSVAYLAVPQNLMWRIFALLQRVGTVLMPKFSSMSDKKEREELLFNSMWFLLLITISVCVPLTILMPDFLRLWIGEEFSISSAQVGQMIAFSFIIQGAFMPVYQYFKGIGKPQYESILVFTTGLISFGSNVVLIPRYGLVGAGSTYLVLMVTSTLLIVVSCRRFIGLDSIKPLFRCVALPFLSAVVALLLEWKMSRVLPVTGWSQLVAVGAGFAILSGIVVIAVERIAGGKTSRVSLLLDNIRPVVRMIFPVRNV